jgi:hypothetical protein
MENTLAPVQPNDGQPQTLHARIACFERKLQTKATFLNGRRCSPNHSIHWKARGSQQTLWEVARYLCAMRWQYRSLYELHLALQDYLQCLETSRQDARWDIARLPQPRRGRPIARWKAEGEALVLSKICPELADVLEAYRPMLKRRRGHLC